MSEQDSDTPESRPADDATATAAPELAGESESAEEPESASAEEPEPEQEPEPAPPERRQARRLPAAALPGLGSVTLHPRDPAHLVNISSSGVLVSCERPLSPSAHAQLILRGHDGEEVVSGRVVRCQVRALDGHRGVAYEAAIECDRELDLDRFATVAKTEDDAAHRRAYGRITGPFEGAWLRTDEGEALTISDLSEGGCFVQQANNLDSGDEVELAITLPTGDLIELTGEVLGADPQLGFAMRFLRLDDETQEQLRHAVALVSADPSDDPGPPVPLLPEPQAPAPVTPPAMSVRCNDW